MKELRGTATALVPAPLTQCLALVEAVDRYPAWYPDVVRTVEVLERDANLDVPRFLPLGGVGDSVAQGFISAASAKLVRRARTPTAAIAGDVLPKDDVAVE